MLLGIIGAMESEIATLRSQLTDRSDLSVAGIAFYRGRLKGREAVISRCGIGKVHAAMCAQLMIERFAPDLILNIGVAGALDERLDIADVVVTQSAVEHDMDTTPIGDPLGLISGPDVVHMPVDQAAAGCLKQVVLSIGKRCVVAAIATGDQFIERLEQKQQIASRFGAAACDMEGGAIAQVCLENGVPYAAYRAISDTLNGNGLEYAVNVIPAAETSARVLEGFLQRWQNGV
ncbi:MAG: 5'-methylthioadenosine/adenosylhomocysteine nucleosidase [Clostridia bacterium]|nr:5'-methylthioadenosine/adenosylhomocysteine nucleosidase [Clostridia bacterium]